MSRYLQHLEKGTELFEKCVYSHNGQWCGLDGYPIIDCLVCKNYKERSVETGIKNPVPVLLDSPVSKKVCISFKFKQYVTAYEAAEAISRFIAEEYKGTIPEQWVKLEKPTYSVCEKDIFIPPRPKG